MGFAELPTPPHSDIDAPLRRVPWRVLGLIAAVAGATSWFVNDLAANDLFWQLAAARELWRTGHIPRVDTLSFTAAGRLWSNHEWLWGALAYPLYQRDPRWLAWANFGLLALIHGCTFELARRHASTSLDERTSEAMTSATAVLATWLAAACGHFFFDLRPQLVTLLFTVVLLVTREARWAPWCWPLVIALWANLHAGHVFGLGMIGLFVMLRRVHAAAWSARAGWLSLACCALALGLTPWGYDLLAYIASYAPGRARSLFAQELNEWQPLGFDPTELRFFGPIAWLASFRGRYFGLVVLGLAGSAVSWRRAPALTLIAAVTVVMAWKAQRFVELSAFVVAPLAAAALTQLLAAGVVRVRTALGRSLLAAVWLATLASAASLYAGARWGPDLFARWIRQDALPRAAVRYVAALDVPLRLLSLEQWGGYVSLNAPRAKVFMDGRSNTVFDDATYRDYVELAAAGPRVPQLVAAYRPDSALLPPSGLAERLLALQPPWRIVYQDTRALLLTAPDGPLATPPKLDPERVLADEPQWLGYRAARAFRAGERARALELMQRALERDPLYLPAYVDLAALLVRDARYAMAERVLQDALVRMPERKAQLLAHVGFTREAAGDRAGANAAFRASIVAGPFQPQTALRKQVEHLDAELAAGHE